MNSTSPVILVSILGASALMGSLIDSTSAANSGIGSAMEEDFTLALSVSTLRGGCRSWRLSHFDKSGAKVSA